MKIVFAAAATLALTAPAFAQSLSQSAGVLSIAPVNSTLVSGTASTGVLRAKSTSPASGSLSVSARTGMSALLTIAAATNSSSGTK